MSACSTSSLMSHFALPICAAICRIVYTPFKYLLRLYLSIALPISEAFGRRSAMAGSLQQPLSSRRVQLPGFGFPLKQKSVLPTATEDWFAKPIMVRERVMIALMATLKDKPNWERKVFDDEIVQTWRGEALQFGRTMTAPESDTTTGPQSESDEDDEDRFKGKRNGNSIEFDGTDLQKQVSERMFDYVKTMASANKSAC